MNNSRPSRGRSPSRVQRAVAILASRRLERVSRADTIALHRFFPNVSRFFRNKQGKLFALRSIAQEKKPSLRVVLFSLEDAPSVVAQVKVDFLQDAAFVHSLGKPSAFFKSRGHSFSKADLRPRGLRVMGAFLEAIVPLARRRGMKSIYLFVENPKLEEYYYSFGFRRAAEYVNTNIKKSMISMVLPLAPRQKK